ncbi:hypothetical protein BAUCODRAFT_149289 [Baudoinia panamericana UAMH 10762]|uniref:Sugar phosphate transporter domain-containing protein n=1 Tax=Baudoinia panamericana (strain UAMH 10762) TaxID=717646 RepID=M2MUN8_BAUPA|nr:uncharacterized protein BAUCODRAFT_149289 [Baudoinia panamericana UAMH 10762]EMC95288.1 hypothetical protein BAUCODRAFT_149289 [Baudoinia panamericana UAMH 10762]
MDSEKAEIMAENEEEAGEMQAFLSQEDPSTTKLRAVSSGISRKYVFSVSINTAAAVGLVFVNKRIFEDDALRRAQVTFANLHFTITAATLYAVSAPPVNMFQRKAVSFWQILPLALSMNLSVVLTNASLAFSSIQFYQVARVLVTPCTALLDLWLLKKRMPAAAALTLVPVCAGVAITSYFDTASKAKDTTRGTGPLGVFFALISICATATYTVLIKKYHELTGCQSAQLLLNQAPASVLVMLYVMPLIDDLTVWRNVSASTWAVILMSGAFACLLHISQFLIIDGAGPVASSVVGHAKTCLIIAIGWMCSKKPLRDGSLIGIVLAVGGIIAYTVVTMKKR